MNLRKNIKFQNRLRSLLLITFFIPCLFGKFIYSANIQNNTGDVVDPDSLSNRKRAYYFTRGLEWEKKRRIEPLSYLKNIAFYIPRQLYYGFRYTSGYGFKLIYNQKFIDNIADFFFKSDKSVRILPIVDLTSSFRPRFGLNLLYQGKKIETLLRGNVADGEKYKLEAIFAYRIRKVNRIWRMTLSTLNEYDDDREFYGIGANPQSDERSYFLAHPQNDYGIYFQRRQKIQLIIGYRPATYWEFYMTNFYQRRRVEDAFEGDKPFGKTFELNILPGVQSSVNIFYSEFSVRFDTRKETPYISSGSRLESYLGIATGINNYNSSYLRAGLDLMVNLPILEKNRVITPRLVFDMIENLRSNVPLAFTEYPRQPSFRGVSGRKIFRTDNYSFVPSLEYHWPLSFNLGGHLFMDYLIVSRSMGQLSPMSGVWAAGLGIDFHSINGELGRVQLAVGSAGLRFILTIGLDPLVNDRTDWE